MHGFDGDFSQMPQNYQRMQQNYQGIACWHHNFDFGIA